MMGHACRLSRTNSNGIVWVCQCGRIGDVTPMHRVAVGATQRERRLIDLTESVARTHHAQHLEDVRADIARDSHAELARIGKLIPLANATQQHRGRWGHP